MNYDRLIGLERQEMLRLPGGETEIMAVQPNDTTALGGAGAGQFVESGPGGFGAGGLGREDFGRWGRQAQQLGAHPAVVQDHLGAPQQFRAPQGEETHFARADTHVIDHAV